MPFDPLSAQMPTAAASKDISLNEDLSIRLAEKIATLKEIFPGKELVNIRDNLDAVSGSLYWAIDRLASSPNSRVVGSTGGSELPDSSPQRPKNYSASNRSLHIEFAPQIPKDRSTLGEQQHIKRLHEMFPSHSNPQLRAVLSKADWDVSLAIESLMSESSSAIMSKASSELSITTRIKGPFSSSCSDSSTKERKADLSASLKIGALPSFVTSTGTRTQNANGKPSREANSAPVFMSQARDVNKIAEAIVIQSIEEQMIEEKLKDVCENDHPFRDDDQSRKLSELGNDKALNARSQVISSRKRRGQELEKRSTKRLLLHTEGEDKDIGVLAPASEWVLNTYSETGGTIVKLIDGVHPRTFPNSLLRGFQPLNDMIEKKPKDAQSGAQILEVSGVSREHWDLVLHWLSTKKMILGSQVYPNTEAKITGLLDLALTGIALGIADLNTEIRGRLRREMMKNRGALKGVHIRRAFELPKDNPIRQLFVKAALRSYFTYHNPKFSSQQRAKEYSSEHCDAAHRAAICGDQYMFQAELDSIADFELAMLKEMRAVMVTRQVFERGGGKKTWVFYRDPLTMESFKMCSC